MKSIERKKLPGAGCINRECREGERMIVSIAGEVIGHVDVLHVPHDGKVRIAFCFLSNVKLSREAT